MYKENKKVLQKVITEGITEGCTEIGSNRTGYIQDTSLEVGELDLLKEYMRNEGKFSTRTYRFPARRMGCLW